MPAYVHTTHPASFIQMSIHALQLLSPLPLQPAAARFHPFSSGRDENSEHAGVATMSTGLEVSYRLLDVQSAPAVRRQENAWPGWFLRVVPLGLFPDHAVTRANLRAGWLPFWRATMVFYMGADTSFLLPLLWGPGYLVVLSVPGPSFS